jgi:hypothetical protein
MIGRYWLVVIQQTHYAHVVLLTAAQLFQPRYKFVFDIARYEVVLH